ncbi:hypothetical protein [Streptantibioticus cattleyicolor]|uniref:Uncharacterized protein n=1 Tax=Streptantibioticus cattleyicolor (strain ATCC 35852 / DSM 46488 / JCM 4925 / NBRC 14057 / NRRL 8057) TaxID=1003195 RepID=F8JNC5_STREN|nr:hypothetical protein [Streptantibioticus cattleyicolor]AEW99114.1 hypothetical protein SCATT_p09210 [Streptantibioticus cattleyicolor NRRL 8057 = DSM 46488]CCB71842.1 exported protein of unknown function [Streptantibioticus cattleyicolor NRRL 8057 = DSM 46488]
MHLLARLLAGTALAACVTVVVVPAWTAPGAPAASGARCGGLSGPRRGVGYDNCAAHAVRIRVGHYVGVGDDYVCVPAFGRYRAPGWNTRVVERIADECR